MLKKTKAVMPCSLSVYKGNIPEALVQFNIAMLQCMIPNTREINKGKEFHRWLSDYRLAQITMGFPISFPYPRPVMIKTGKPVLGITQTVWALDLQCSEFTKNTVTFHNDEENQISTLIINEDEVEGTFKEGIYKVSVLIDAPTEWWVVDKKKSSYLINTEARFNAELVLNIEEYLGQPTQQKKPDTILNYFINDFKKTFAL